MNVVCFMNNEDKILLHTTTAKDKVEGFICKGKFCFVRILVQHRLEILSLRCFPHSQQGFFTIVNSEIDFLTLLKINDASDRLRK